MQPTHEAHDIHIAAFIVAAERLINLLTAVFVVIKPRGELTEIEHIYSRASNVI